MTSTRDALREFGQRMGIEGLTLDSNSVVQLQLGTATVLGVEAGKGEVLVYTIQQMQYAPAEQWLDALKRCHIRRRGAWPIQVGCRESPSGREIVVVTRVPDHTLTSQQLEEAAHSVLQWRELWASGATR